MAERTVIKVGFTGTRGRLTDAQQVRLGTTLARLAQRAAEDDAVVELHHGDCIGADAACHDMAEMLDFRVVIHPPTVGKYRAFCGDGDERIAHRPAKPYLDRNRDIVAETGMLIACPKAAHDDGRSGSWYTIRQARSANKPVVVIGP